MSIERMLDINLWESFGISNYDKFNEYTDFIRNKYYNKYESKPFNFHHIVPRSIRIDLKDEQDNLIKLHPRDHFHAHMLLIEFLSGDIRDKMIFAINGFRNSKNRKTFSITDDELSYINKIWVEMMSRRFSGESNIVYNKEVLDKISKTNRNKVVVHKGSKTIKVDIDLVNKYLEDGYELGMSLVDYEAWVVNNMNRNYGDRHGENNSFYNKTHTEESKRLIGSKSVGRKKTKEGRMSISKSNKGNKKGMSNKGNKHSDKHNKSMSSSISGMIMYNNGLLNIRTKSKTEIDFIVSRGWTKGFSKGAKSNTMKIGRKVIVCGVDGSGKDTFINKYISEHNDVDWKVIHCTRNTPNTFEYFSSLLLNEENIIFNRFVFGSWVYQDSDERKEKGWTTSDDLLELCFLMKKIKHEMYYVYADPEVCLYNCKKDKEDSYYTIDYIRELDLKFRQTFAVLGVGVFYYYNDYHPKEIGVTKEDKYKIVSKFNYESLPRIYAVDFDKTIAKNAFPEIVNAVPNDKLIEFLKKQRESGVKLILWTNRTDQHLIDACNWCADRGLYFDAVNENIEEVSNPLFGGPRKVYASGYIDDKSISLRDIGMEF